MTSLLAFFHFPFGTPVKTVQLLVSFHHEYRLPLPKYELNNIRKSNWRHLHKAHPFGDKLLFVLITP